MGKPRKERRARCKQCGQLFDTLGKCMHCRRWLCDPCFWPSGKKVGNTCEACRGKRPRKNTKPNCVTVEFKGQSLVIPIPRAKKVVDRFHELSDFQDALVRAVLAAVNESYREHLPVTIKAEIIPLTTLGQPWEGWE